MSALHTQAPRPTEPVDTLALLEAAWRRSDLLFELIPPGGLLQRPIALRHPFLFYLGHMPAFAYNHIAVGALGRPPLHGTFEALFERGIDPLDRDDAAAATRAQWPSAADVRSFRDRVREVVRESAAELAAAGEAGPDAAPMAFRMRAHHLVLEHELMHHETLLYMLQRAPVASLRRPASVPDPVLGADEGAPSPVVALPGGEAHLGVRLADVPFAWDNELGPTQVPVAPFGLDQLPVTIARFRAFVDDGGYRRDALWRPEDRAWRDRGPADPGHAASSGPLSYASSWVDVGGALHARWLFGLVPLDACGGWPVQVSYAEARAFARWAGGRLPTEAELHHAAYGAASARERATDRPWPWGDAPLDTTRAAVDFHTWAPTPVGQHPAGRSALGVDELVGNGWEWTDTPFAPLPGFDTWHRSYPGYSSDFFDGAHMVVFGGSWATDSTLLRRSFRNWYQGRYPYVFSKFRLAWDAD